MLFFCPFKAFNREISCSLLDIELGILKIQPSVSTAGFFLSFPLGKHPPNFTLMNPISAWLLKEGSYEEGVILYMQYGSDPLLKKLFQETYSPFKEQKLKQVLTKLVSSPQQDVTVVTERKEAPAPEAPKVFTGWPEAKDEVVTALHAQWKPLFAEMMNLMARIYDVAKAGLTDPAKHREAGIMAHRILDLDDACTDVYEKRDYYLQHGKLPEGEQPVKLITDPKKYPIALQNHKRYLRDYKAKLLKHPDDVKIALQIKKHEWAINQYQKLLGIES